MSKVVLLSLNARYIHTSLAVYALASGIREFSGLEHDVKIIEATINSVMEEVFSQVVREKPDVIGIPVYIWNSAELPELISTLRLSLPAAKVVLGGPEATYNAKFWIQNGADYIIRGEGERNFAALLDDLETGTQVQQISEMCEICMPEPPDPCTGEYLAAVNGKLAYMETSRGCPFSCEFCLSGGSKLRFFSLSRAKSQIDRLAKSGAKTVKLVDRTFNCNPERARELFAYVIALETGCCFHFEVAADLFDDETLTLLESAPKGRIQLEIGLQSFNEGSLRAVSRITDLEKAARSIERLVAAGNIHVHVDLIAGLPHETLESFQSGFDRAYALNAHTLQLGFLKLLHGSRLRERAAVFGLEYGQNPPYEIISTESMSAAELGIIRQAENALQRTRNSGKLLSAIEYVLEATGLSAFAFYSWLGDAILNDGMELTDYVYLVYEYCCTLSGVDAALLRDYFVCDHLAATKGRNMPENLKIHDKRLKQAAKAVEEKLGRKPQRCEVAMLATQDKAVFVDSTERDAVTGLYAIDFIAAAR